MPLLLPWLPGAEAGEGKAACARAERGQQEGRALRLLLAPL